MHELRERLRLLMMTDLDLLVVGQPIPDARLEDGDEPVIDLLRVLRLELERPIDPDGRVPSLFLPLVIERQQLRALILVLPGERSLGCAIKGPPSLGNRQLIRY